MKKTVLFIAILFLAVVVKSSAQALYIHNNSACSINFIIAAHDSHSIGTCGAFGSNVITLASGSNIYISDPTQLDPGGSACTGSLGICWSGSATIGSSPQWDELKVWTSTGTCTAHLGDPSSGCSPASSIFFGTSCCSPNGINGFWELYLGDTYFSFQ